LLLRKNLKNLTLNIPNLLSISRLFLVFPLILFLEINRPFYVFILIIIGGLTDYFDGLIASKFNLNSSIKDEFESFLNKQSMKTEYSFNSNQSELKEIISNDKKVTSDVVKFVLIKNIQEPVLIDFSINDLLEVLTNA